MIAEIQALDAKLQDKISRLQAQAPQLERNYCSIDGTDSCGTDVQGHTRYGA